MVLKLSVMLPQLVLLFPNMKPSILVVQDIMLGLKFRSRVEIVGKYGRLMWKFAELSCGESWRIAGLSSLFCGNDHPITFTLRKYKHIGGFEELPLRDSASCVTIKHGVILPYSVQA